MWWLITDKHRDDLLPDCLRQQENISDYMGVMHEAQYLKNMNMEVAFEN